MLRRSRENNPMDSEHKATVLGIMVAGFVAMGIIGSMSYSSMTSQEHNADERQDIRDLCREDPNPSGCLITLERIDACKDLEDGEDNCLTNLQNDD